MSLQTLLSIAGLPGMDLAVTLAFELAKSVQDVKLYRAQCRDLSDRCTRLLVAFREKCTGLEGTEFMTAADEVSSIIERAHRKVQSWSSMSRIRSFVYQGEIKNGLEQLYRDIDLCAQQFSIASSAELHRGQRDLQAIRERDNAENREILHSILRSVDGLRDVFQLNEPSAVQGIMQTIQEELQQQTVQPDEQRDLERGLRQIYRETKILPPMIDLTGQVTKTSDHPVAYGGHNDVYTGVWLDEYKVALRFARAINHTPKARKRFHKEVEIWRDLQHPHVSRLYGIVYFGHQIYSVSAWMENGSALKYINESEEVVDRLRILRDVASGMEYLHRRGVVHGDLRAANILIDDKGNACVSDFGLSKVIEEVAPEMSSTNGDSPVRWQARELVKPDDYGGDVLVSPSTDVWSFGMLCLEIMTGNRPYNNRLRDSNVIEDLVAKRLPDRPMDEEVIGRGLNDRLWNVMMVCWQWDPVQRPTMSDVREALRSTRSSALSSSPFVSGNTLTESPKPFARDLPSASLSPPNPSYPRYPPVSSPGRSSTTTFQPQRPATAPRSNVDVSRTFTRYHAGSVSSTSSCGSTFPTHRPSTSQRPSLPPLTDAPSTSHSSSVLGLSLRQQSSRGSFSSGGPTNPVPIVYQTSSGRQNSREMLGLPPLRRDTSPSGLTLTMPSSSLNEGLRFSVSDLSDILTTPPTGSPPIVNVQDGDGDMSRISALLPSTFEFPLPPQTPGSLGPNSSHRTGLLHSPPKQPSIEHLEEHFSGGSVSSSFPSSIDSALRSRVSESSLTNFTNLDFNIQIRFKPDGSVKAGTLAGLVDRLIKDTPGNDGYSRDQEFREIFLTTLRLFSSPEEVLKHLVHRFTLANEDQSMRVEDKVSTRYLVLDVIRQWLKGHYSKSLEGPVLKDLRSFLKSITSPPAFLKFANELVLLIDDLTASMNGDRVMSPTFSQSDKRSVRASDMTPTGLAIALRILEGANYRAITATDCISYLLHQNGPSKVAEARVINNKIVNWVKKSVTRSDRMEHRGDTLRFFVNTAVECRKIRNYASMSAIIAGIDSPTITRLKLTRGCLDKQMRETQKKLSGIFDPVHNHRTYREIIPSADKGACIPWLAVHLKDLQVAFERNQRQVIIDGQSMINMEKYKGVYDSVISVLAYQKYIQDHQPFLDREGKPGPLAYLEEQLAATVIGKAAEDKLEARSLELQKQEDRDYEHRVNELAAVGFRTSRGRG